MKVDCPECDGRGWTVTSKTVMTQDRDPDGELVGQPYPVEEPTQELCGVCYGEGALRAIPLPQWEEIQTTLANRKTIIDWTDEALDWLAGQWAAERHLEGQHEGPNCPLQPSVDLQDIYSCPYTHDGQCGVLHDQMTYQDCAVRTAIAEAGDAQ